MQSKTIQTFSSSLTAWQCVILLSFLHILPSMMTLSLLQLSDQEIFETVAVPAAPVEESSDSVEEPAVEPPTASEALAAMTTFTRFF